MINVADAIRARRSIKRFTDAPVSREQIEALLSAAVLAPNHRLTEPWRFWDPAARAVVGAHDDERIVAIVNVGVPAETPAPKPRGTAASRTTWVP